MNRYRRLFTAFAILFAFAGIAASAQTPPAPAQRGFAPPPDAAPARHGRHYIVAIGIDHYQNWPVLSTAVNDADEFAKLLTTQFGFEYAAEPLTEKNATRDNINSLIDDELRSKLKPEDDLVIFFAGHGTTRNDQIGDQAQSVGFLVPFEARAPGRTEHWSDYLNIEELLRNISTLPSTHILVILDSCHSGMALGSKFTTSRADTRFQQDMLRKVSRKAITSAQGDQLAADNGPLPGHSLFTGLMMQGLMSGKADNFGQGFITATQLGAYTQHEVGVEEGSRQTPLFGAFDLDAGGELIIPLGAGGKASADAANPAALTKLEQAEVAKIRQQDRLYWQDDDALKNFPAARSAALKLCAANDGWGCAQAANSFHFGLGGAPDYTRAVELARQGCQAKFAEACVVLGVLYQSGQTIQPDIQSARQLYEQACAQGDLHGCADLGSLYSDGVGVPRDPARAGALLRKACDGGEVVGCNNLALLYQSPHGIGQDLPQAAALLQKTCESGLEVGCGNVGMSYLKGIGVARDPSRAAEYFRRSCDKGEMQGCASLADLLSRGIGVPKDPPQAVALYRKACDAGHMSACDSLGVLHEMGLGVPQDFVQAVALYRQACNGGEMTGCNFLGQLYADGSGVDKPDNTIAASLFRKACEGGEPESCKFLGDMYLDGKGVVQDEIQSDVYYALACDGGEIPGCTLLAGMIQSGRGAPKDPAKATALYKKACDSHDKDACTALAAVHAQ